MAKFRLDQVDSKPVFGALDGSWTVINSRTTWTEGPGGLITAETEGDSSAYDWQSIVKPVTPVPGMNIDVEIVSAAGLAVASEFLMFGVGFTNGTTSASGLVMSGGYYSNGTAPGRPYLNLRKFSNHSTYETQAGEAYGICGPRMFLRCQYVSANTFSTLFSCDGSNWVRLYTSFSNTFTPTHAGIFVNTNGFDAGDDTVVNFANFSIS